VDSTPQAYRLKASNAAPPISTSAGTSPCVEDSDHLSSDGDESEELWLSGGDEFVAEEFKYGIMTLGKPRFKRFGVAESELPRGMLK